MFSTKGYVSSLITLFHKDGLKENLSNWCLITLLNVLHKIDAKAHQKALLAYFLRDHRPRLVHISFVRYIFTNIFVLHETLKWVRKSKQDVVFLRLDFSKAYD
jgi:hypothetical protein